MYQVWNESFQFAVPAGGGSDLVTLVVWSVTDGNKRENIGHIAVPASRVASTGKEEVGFATALHVSRCVEITTRHDTTLLHSASCTAMQRCSISRALKLILSFNYAQLDSETHVSIACCRDGMRFGQQTDRF